MMRQSTTNDMRRIAATLLIVLVLAGPAPAQFSPPVQERSTELTDVLRKQALALHERSSSDLRWTFTQTNAPFDLTGVDQVIFNYAPRTGGFTQVITGSVFNATAGIILIPFTPANTSTNGTFEWNIEVSQGGNPILKSPFGDLNLIRRPGGGSTNVFPTTGTPIDLAGIDFLNFPWILAAFPSDLETVLASGNESTNYVVLAGITNTGFLVLTNGSFILGDDPLIPGLSSIRRIDDGGILQLDGGILGSGASLTLSGPGIGIPNRANIRADGGIRFQPRTSSPPEFYLFMTGDVVRIGVDLIPDTNGVRNLGSPDDRFATLFLETNSIDMKTVILSADNGALLINGTAVVTNNQTSVTLSGTFSGNLAGGTNLNADNVAAGTLADLRLSANVDLLDGTRAWTDDHNAGGQPLTNLDTTVTLGMDDGSIVFVDGTSIFYVSADGSTTNDLTDSGMAVPSTLFSRSITLSAPTNVIVFRPVFTNLPVANITMEDVGENHSVEIVDVFTNRVIFTVTDTNGVAIFSNIIAHIVAWEETSDFYPSLNALTFDGVDEYVAVPDANVLDFGPATDFSITFWMKMGAEADFVSLVNKQDANNFDNSGWSVLASGGGMRMLQFRIGSGGTNAENDHLNGTVDLGDGNWHFCVISVERGVVIVTYVDGARDCPTTSLSGFGGTMNNAEELWMGRRKLTASDGFFTGTMDNVNIFNVALTSLQVQEMYNAGEPSDPDTLSMEADRVGSWNLGDPPDTFDDLNDTINNNDGNGVNMAIGNIVTDTPTP